MTLKADRRLSGHSDCRPAQRDQGPFWTRVVSHPVAALPATDGGMASLLFAAFPSVLSYPMSNRA
jgi:hypothetical protein